ncbi:MAG TPA: hypothetical protein VLM38_23110 [Blastocatellia bacterium]|nr:hypothetical protein [Blastocatellia bacterium]
MKIEYLRCCARIGMVVIACSMTASAVLSQLPRDNRPQPWPDGRPPKPKPGDRENIDLESDRKAMERDSKRLERRTNSSIPNKRASGELTPAQKKLLSPAQEDFDRFKSFLRLPDTGLIRLFPKGRFVYSPNLVSASDLKPVLTLPITGGGATYSFTKRKHEMSEWSELAFQDGMLLSGFAGGALGFMASLGDVPLEAVSLKTAGVDHLQELPRPRNRSEAILQSKRNSEGFKVGEVTYYSVLPAVPGSTYILRSMAEGRSDILVAFRVCRKDEDKSLIISWRRLKKDSAPVLQ